MFVSIADEQHRGTFMTNWYYTLTSYSRHRCAESILPLRTSPAAVDPYRMVSLMGILAGLNYVPIGLEGFPCCMLHRWWAPPDTDLHNPLNQPDSDRSLQVKCISIPVPTVQALFTESQSQLHLGARPISKGRGKMPLYPA